MTESPSGILSRAADLIRDTAAAASPGPWTVEPSDYEWDVSDEVRGDWLHGRVKLSADTTPRKPTSCWIKTQDQGIGYAYESSHEGSIDLNDGAWIALLNPAVAPALEAWLRNSAREYAKLEHLAVAINPEDPPMYFALRVLGLENTPEETP